MGTRKRPVSPASVRTSTLRVPGILMILIGFAVLVGGCSILGADGSSPVTAKPPQPTAEVSPASSGAGFPAGLEESVALIRPSGEPDEISGSAVVMSSTGLLVTSADVVSSDMEVVLPSGDVFRPVLVSVEPDINLALLKVPARRLVPARFSTERLSEGAEVFATGYDGTPGSIGRMSGSVVRTIESDDSLNYRVRGALWIDTDINLIPGFLGGVLSDDDGAFAGVLLPGEDEDGNSTARAVSNWVVLSWLESRETHLNELEEQAESWKRFSLPGDWRIGHPEGWSADVSAEDEANFKAELSPGDPDASLQLSISVEPNQFGSDPDAFVENLFEDRGNATLWGISRVEGNPLVRLTVAQEGALIDVAYLLGEEHMIAVSMTSGYQPDEDQAQTDEARALFQTVLDSLERGD